MLSCGSVTVSVSVSVSVSVNESKGNPKQVDSEGEAMEEAEYMHTRRGLREHVHRESSLLTTYWSESTISS